MGDQARNDVNTAWLTVQVPGDLGGTDGRATAEADSIHDECR